MADRLSSTHWGTVAVDVAGGRVVGTRPFARDPHPSDIRGGLVELLYAANRVAKPMVRRGWLEGRGRDGNQGRGRDPFVPVAWDEALDLVAGELARVRDTYGHSAIFGGSYGWSSAGNFHHARTQARRFLGAFGGFVDQVTNYSYGAALVLLPHIIGTDAPIGGPLTTWRNIAKHTDLMVMFGGANIPNMQINSGGCGEHSSESWLHEAKAGGTHFVLVTPVREPLTDFLDAEWIAPRPNSDTALMLGLAHTIYANGLHDADFLARCCVGFERFVPYLTGAADGQPKSASWAAAITGIPEADIVNLARRMAIGRTMLAGSWSLQRADHGEQPYWMLIVLAAMLGQIGLPGGGFGFGYGSINGPGVPVPELGAARMSAGRNPLNFAIPVARFADMLLSPGETIDFNGSKLTYPDIKLVYWAGGNPFHHHQDLNRLIEAFRRPETVIVHEIFWTASARHADIVLPATTSFERNDIGASSRDRFIIAMQKHVEPVGEARNDFDIFNALAHRLGVSEKFAEGRDEMAWVRHLYDTYSESIVASGFNLPPFDTFWEDGYVELPVPARDFILFEDFRRDPEAHPLRTRSGRIEIFSETIAGFGYPDCPPHPTWLKPREWLLAAGSAEFPLHLITNQPRTRLHSQLDGFGVSRESKVAEREPLRINPADAERRNIRTGDVVELFNARGRCLAGALVTDAIRPGVVQLSVGAWYDPVEPGVVGALEKHGNPNVLTTDQGTSRLAQGPSPMSTLVEVRKFAGEPPAVSAHRLPEIAEA